MRLVAIALSLLILVGTFALFGQMLLSNVSSDTSLDFTNIVGIWGMGPDPGANNIPWWTQRRNFLLWSEDFSSALWEKMGTFTVAVDADSLVFGGATHDVRQYHTLTGPVTFAVDVKGIDGETVVIGIGGSTSIVPTLTGNWTRYIVSGTAAASNYVWIGTWGGATARNIDVRYAHVNVGATALPYEKTTDGQRVWDFSPAGNHLQLGSTAGADTNDPTKVAEGYSFTTDDYLAKDSGLIGLEPIKTVTVLLQASSQTKVIYGEGNSGDDNPVFSIYCSGEKGNVFVRAGTTLDTTTAGNVCDGNWHCLTLTDNTGAWKISVDGITDSSGTYTQALPSTNLTTVGAIRRTGTQDYITAKIAALLVLSGAINATTQYRVIYNRICLPRGLACAALTAYFRWERMGEWASLLPFMGPGNFDPLGVRR